MEQNKIKELIESKSGLFPFISKFYSIEILEKETNHINTKISFGHNNTENDHSIPFYKPMSSLIDFNEIYEK